MTSSAQPTQLVTRRSLALCGIVIVVYVAFWLLIHNLVGLPGALGLAPVILCGWLLGRKAGFVMSLGIALLTISLILLFGDGWSRVRETWLGFAAISVLGLIIGWFREIYEATRTQAAELRATQAELSRLNVELEARVAARTEEIQHLNASLEKRVAERTEELSAANAQLEAYNNMVAHDLRAPLTLVQTYNDFLRMYYTGKPLDKQGTDMLQGIYDATQRMRALIQDLFDFSRLRDEELNIEPVDLSTLATEVMTELQKTEPGRTVALAITPNLETYGDARYLRVLLDNLLSNAWKYTGKQDVARIELSVEDVNGECIYRVRDNGSGFPANQAVRLFEPFQRYSSEFPGTGLGLATCKRIVERHGGRIWAESQVGAGTTVYFVLANGNGMGEE